MLRLKNQWDPTLTFIPDGKCYTAGLHFKDVASDNYDDHIASGGTAYMGQMSASIPNAFDLSIGKYPCHINRSTLL